METPPRESQPSRFRALLPALGLTALVVAVYANTFSVPFLLDDLATILGNPSLRTLWPLSSVLFPPPEVYSAGRPLLNLSFALNFAVGGTSVTGYHVVNLLIHVAAALTLLGVLNRILSLSPFQDCPEKDRRLFSVACAGIWAVHPLNTSAVTYVSQRAECLMGLFYLVTVYCFLRSISALGNRWRWASIAACAGGMATKEVMVTAPVVILLCDAHYVAGSLRTAWQQRKGYYLGLAATWVVLGSLMLISRLDQRAVGFNQGLSSFAYLQLEATAIVRYLRLAFWPDSLVFDYGPNLSPPSVVAVAGCILALTTLLGVGVRGVWRQQRWGLPIVAFFLLLSPTSSIIPLAGQPIAESRLYLPLIAIVLAAAAFAARFVMASRIHQGLVLGGAVLALGGLTFDRNGDYQTAIHIWNDTTAKRPKNSRAWVFYSEELKAKGKTQAAINALTTAIHHDPFSAEQHNNLAMAFFTAGKIPEALANLEKAVRLNPRYSSAYQNYGTIAFQAGNFALALEAFKRALAIDPNSADAENFSGLCQFRLGNFAAAAAHFEAAARLAPQHPHARSNLELARGKLKG